MRPKLRTVVSRLVVAVGFFVGLFALAVFGMARVPLGDRDAGWFLSWFGFAGVGLLALGFLVGSLVALRHARRAGIIFLFFLPITAFCLGYPGSGFLGQRCPTLPNLQEIACHNSNEIAVSRTYLAVKSRLTRYRTDEIPANPQSPARGSTGSWSVVDTLTPRFPFQAVPQYIRKLSWPEVEPFSCPSQLPQKLHKERSAASA
jgi:hypothetical protein